MRFVVRRALLSLPAGLLAAGLLAPAAPSVAVLDGRVEIAEVDRRRSEPERLPLVERIVVLDPGHQLGNRNHPAEVASPVPVAPGSSATKPCNTAGSETADGLAEATIAWQVSTRLRDRLHQHGARVLLTRRSDSEAAWGPCVDERGRIGNGLDADLKVSIHADGNHDPEAVGFHVIAPGPEHRRADPSAEFARTARNALRDAGLPVSSYLGKRGLDTRTDLATLNHSQIPTVVVELGNLRADDDAALLSSRRGQARYADALACAVLTHLSGTDC